MTWQNPIGSLRASNPHASENPFRGSHQIGDCIEAIVHYCPPDWCVDVFVDSKYEDGARGTSFGAVERWISEKYPNARAVEVSPAKAEEFFARSSRRANPNGPNWLSPDPFGAR